MQHPGLSLLSPAKLNLFLHVVGRRADGYHLLQSLFVLIDWCDRVHLRPHEAGIHRLGHIEWPEEEDLALRAAQLLRAEGLRLGRLRESTGCDIRIEKEIPAGAGLGGGSSNAATVLLGLNALWQLDLSLSHLKGLGLQLGADVPFFLHGQAAFAQGVGEDLESHPVSARWFVVGVPPVHVATARVFQDPALTRNTKATTISSLANPASDSSLDGGRGGRGGRGGCSDGAAWSYGHNDLESVACRLFPAVQDLIQAFREASQSIGWSVEQARNQIRMSGSGGAVFGSCASEDEARSLGEALWAQPLLQEAGMLGQTQVVVCEQLSQSPVHLQLPLR